MPLLHAIDRTRERVGAVLVAHARPTDASHLELGLTTKELLARTQALLADPRFNDLGHGTLSVWGQRSARKRAFPCPGVKAPEGQDGLSKRSRGRQLGHVSRSGIG